MTHGTFRRVTLDLRQQDLLPVPRLPEGEARAKILACFLRELFTTDRGRLRARSGAVFLDEQDRPRALTAPFADEWPRADAQGLELLARAKKTGWTRLILFRSEPNSYTLPDIALHFVQDMRALGLLFAVEVVDLLILKPERCWILSKAPIIRATLDCEATLNRAFNHLIARAFERSFPPIEIPAPTEHGVPLAVERLIEEGPFVGHGSEGA